MRAPAGKFVELGKRLDDVAKNVADSYAVSIDGDGRGYIEQKAMAFLTKWSPK